MKYDTNPNFMHYCKGTPPKITIHLHCLIPPQYGSHLMIHGQCSQVSEWGGFGTGRVRYMMGSKVTLLRHHCGIPARFIWNLTKKGTKWDVYIGSTLTQDGIKKTYPYNNIIMSIITCTYVNINKYIYIYMRKIRRSATLFFIEVNESRHLQAGEKTDHIFVVNSAGGIFKSRNLNSQVEIGRHRSFCLRKKGSRSKQHIWRRFFCGEFVGKDSEISTWTFQISKKVKLSVIWKNTNHIHPRNLTLNTKNDGLENVSPFKHGYFGYLC